MANITNGTVSVTITGGVGPYRYTLLDAGNLQPIPQDAYATFTNPINNVSQESITFGDSTDETGNSGLVSGSYRVRVIDGNDCITISGELIVSDEAVDLCAAFGVASSSTSLATNNCDIFTVDNTTITDTVTVPDPTATDVPDPTATPVPDPTATDVPDPTATPEPTATAIPDPTATPAPTAPQEWNILLMSGGFSFNGLHWQTANNGGNYDNIPSNNISGFSFTNTLDNGLLDTTLIQNLLDDAYVFEQDPSIANWPQLHAGPYGGATYFGPGIGQVQVGQQLYDGYSTNPYTQDSSSSYAAGAAQVSLIEGGNMYVQVPGGPRMGTENQEWQQNGGTIRVIAWDDNGIVTDVQDFTVPATP